MNIPSANVIPCWEKRISFHSIYRFREDSRQYRLKLYQKRRLLHNLKQLVKCLKRRKRNCSQKNEKNLIFYLCPSSRYFSLLDYSQRNGFISIVKFSPFTIFFLLFPYYPASRCIMHTVLFCIIIFVNNGICILGPLIS